MPALKRVALYARVSDDDQSPQLQVDELRACVARRDGWQIVGEYVDHARAARRTSGRSSTR